ncbi:septum formation family protein [Nocardioides sp. GXZ039]|uniref:septum formation family protein n=1 Tax=Nocardioides sp. GXZ039 TaxID=3136018 RepID=UPI0030F39CFA
MSESRRALPPLLVAVAVLLTVLVGCSSDSEPDPDPTSSAPSTPTQTPTPPPRATAAPSPEAGACHQITYRQAVAPTSSPKTVPCRDAHTAETISVGRLDNLVDGHLLAVDSAQVQDQVAAACPDALGSFVGGTAEDRRLSMLRAVWFTPSLEEAAAGAAWYRCDVVALAGRDRLATVKGSLEGVLGTESGRDQYGMCGTASPKAKGFARVPCGAQHSWRAFDVIELPEGKYPGAGAISTAGNQCEDAATAVADDPLDFEWASEGPDRAQWDAGQNYLLCWTAV